MIFPTKLPVIAISLLLVSGSLTADPLAEQLTFASWTSGTFKSTWPGVAQRTYFYQWSPDLVTWHYAPFMAFGDGGHEHFMDASPGKLFVRLHRVDDSTVTTLQGAKDADFDGDGIRNYSEVTDCHTFPTLWDTDGDLVPDGLEVALGTSPVLNQATDDDDGDGMKNAEEYIAGRDPAAADPVSDTSSRSLDVFNLTSF